MKATLLGTKINLDLHTHDKKGQSKICSPYTDPEGGPDPTHSKNHKAIGFLSNTGPRIP